MNRANRIAALVVLTMSIEGCGGSRPATAPPPQPETTHGETHPTPATNAVSDVSTTPETEQPPAAAQPAEDLVALEQAAYERARPVFEEHCARCHSSAGKRAGRGALKHFSMDTYPFGGHHAMEITTEIREVLGVTGDEATMPKDKPGAVQGEQLALITAWADAFDRTHAAGLHSAHGAAGDGHTGHAR